MESFPKIKVALFGSFHNLESEMTTYRWSEASKTEVLEASIFFGGRLKLLKSLAQFFSISDDEFFSA